MNNKIEFITNRTIDNGLTVDEWIYIYNNYEKCDAVLQTVKENGGGTYNKELKEEHKNNGYYVSQFGTESTFDVDILTYYPDYKELNNIIELVLYITYRLKKNEYVGFWIDNGLLYIDISKHYKDKQQAIKTGIKNKQLSIYNCKDNTCINLLKNTYILYTFNNINNDIQYKTETENIKSLIDYFECNNINISESTLYSKMINNIDDITDYKSYLINDEYIIVKDRIFINEI